MEKKIEFEEDLVKAVLEDFKSRQEERREIEKQWKLNINYFVGNQYCEVATNGEVVLKDKDYFWQDRSVYNHIAPIIDSRLAKLSKIRPMPLVRASGGEEKDLKTAEISTEILNSTVENVGLDKIIKKVTEWAEVTGTGFYKVVWDDRGGKNLSKTKDKVFEGDVSISSISPFEIFPDCLYVQDVNDLKSIIHARPINVLDVEKIYGVKLSGEDIDVFTFGSSSFNYNGGYKSVNTSSPMHNSVMVIERYEKPTKQYPNGRVLTVAGNKLLQSSDLPFKNGVDGQREFPFIKQTALNKTGCFFGVSIIERLIPLQKAYNAIKNRKHEFLNRISMGMVAVEDGSVDINELETEGLSPGKILVYRQGGTPPTMFSSGSVPIDFTREEERLLNEFTTISGVSELSRNIDSYSSSLSGSAIELLMEQDNTRISVTAESIKDAIKDLAKNILRLYKQFASATRIVKCAGENKKVKVFYFNASDISSDDVIFDTEYEITRSPAQKKNAVMEMLNAGLLTDQNGQISSTTKAKILDILGYGSLSNANDLINLHRNKAEKENIDAGLKELKVGDFDDHSVHIEEHTRKILSVDESENIRVINALTAHVKEHEKALLKINIQNLVGEQNE